MIYDISVTHDWRYQHSHVEISCLSPSDVGCLATVVNSIADLKTDDKKKEDDRHNLCLRIAQGSELHRKSFVSRSIHVDTSKIH